MTYRAATEPREAATFVWHLIMEADGDAGDSSWALRQTFADRAASAQVRVVMTATRLANT